jgi:hypothetical protein
MATPNGSFASFEGAAEPAKVAGIAPRLEPRETGKGFGPSRDPKRGSSKRLRPWRRAPGERQGLRAAPRSERGFFARLRLFGRFLERRDGFGPASFERATGEVSASMRALETARLRPGPIRQGSEGGISVLPERPDGDRRGASRPSAETHRVPNGASPPRSGIRGKAKRAFAPASQSKAAQREMASPPSDGSQSWDKWGPVATPAPIMIPSQITGPPEVG